MEDVTKLKISNVEKERLLIKNLNNRPNAMATYGQAKMSSTEAKDVFDKQFELITTKFNELCDLIADLNSSFATDEELQKGVKSAKGVAGHVTLSSDQWDSNENGITASHTFADLGENDLILFSPASAADKDRIMKSDLFILPENIDKTVTFYATQAPTEAITLYYFITRGV